MSDLMLDVGLANEIKLAARRAGATNEDLKILAEGDNLARILPVLRGRAEVQMRKHLIDCDTSPFIPNGWLVESHRKMGQIEFAPNAVELWLSDSQKGGVVVGKELRKEIDQLDGVMNANILDYLLEHKELIPESWKGRAVFFWGTIYRDGRGGLFVRYLSWDGVRWDWDYGWLFDDWNGNSPAARVRK